MILKDVGFMLLAFSLVATVSCTEEAKVEDDFVVTGAASAGETASAFCTGCAGSPTSINLKIYALAISENADCTDPQWIFDYGDTPIDVNMVNAPTLFRGRPPRGTFECLIMRMSDNITFRANQAAVDAHAGCTSTTEDIIHDVLRNDGSDATVWRDYQGELITKRGTVRAPVEDIIETFVTTNIAAPVSGPLGVSENQVLLLTEALQIPGSTVFYVDANDGIANNLSGGENSCFLEEAIFGIR